MAQARGFFERALALDPGNVEAMVGMARVDVAIGSCLYDRRPVSASCGGRGDRQQRRCPSHRTTPWLTCVLGFVQMFTNRAAQGIAECEQALALDRNLARAHALIGLAKFFSVEARKPKPTSTRHSAFLLATPLLYRWMYVCRPCQGSARRRRRSGRLAAPEPRGQPKLSHSRISISRLPWRSLGELDEARAAVQAGLALDPSFTIRRYRANTPSDNPVYLAGRERVYEGMRLAGVPEG